MSDDVAAVRELIGRTPRGAFEVVVRDDAGAPVVLRNAPLFDGGEPMPTRYWLVGKREVLAVSRLEAGGAVRRAEAEIDPRWSPTPMPATPPSATPTLPADHIGPRPHGGVGGTRTGIKCLHAHYAWFLAGGDDPVGAWVAQRLDEQVDESHVNAVMIRLGDDDTVVDLDGQHHVIPLGAVTLSSNELVSDPPRPEELTNAIGLVVDHLDDMLRALPRRERSRRGRHRRRSGHRDRRGRVRRHAAAAVRASP